MLAAELTPRFCRVPVPPAVSTAALLHDIGKLVMARFLDADILNLLGEAQDEGALTHICDEALAAFSKVGALLGAAWFRWNVMTGWIQAQPFHFRPNLTNFETLESVKLG